MSKRSKAASTQEISIELADWAQDALVEVLEQTRWVEQPFRDAAIHLERERDRFFDSGCREYFFAGQYFVQSTDEDRFLLPMVELLGVLFAWETQIRDFGKEWFKERTDHLLALMRTLPPEQDTTLLALLYALDPSARKIISRYASKAARARHEEDYAAKARALADWQAEGHNYRSRRDFAVNCYERYGVKDFTTTYRWLLDAAKAKY